MLWVKVPEFGCKASRSDTGSQSGVISNSTGPSQTMYQTYEIGTARSNRVESINQSGFPNGSKADKAENSFGRFLLKEVLSF